MKLIDIPGVGEIKAQSLEKAGFGTIEALQVAEKSDLCLLYTSPSPRARG